MQDLCSSGNAVSHCARTSRRTPLQQPTAAAAMASGLSLSRSLLEAFLRSRQYPGFQKRSGLLSCANRLLPIHPANLHDSNVRGSIYQLDVKVVRQGVIDQILSPEHVLRAQTALPNNSTMLSVCLAQIALSRICPLPACNRTRLASIASLFNGVRSASACTLTAGMSENRRSSMRSNFGDRGKRGH